MNIKDFFLTILLIVIIIRFFWYGYIFIDYYNNFEYVSFFTIFLYLFWLLILFMFFISFFNIINLYLYFNWNKEKKESRLKNIYNLLLTSINVESLYVWLIFLEILVSIISFDFKHIEQIIANIPIIIIYLTTIYLLYQIKKINIKN